MKAIEIENFSNIFFSPLSTFRSIRWASAECRQDEAAAIVVCLLTIFRLKFKLVFVIVIIISTTRVVYTTPLA